MSQVHDFFPGRRRRRGCPWTAVKALLLLSALLVLGLHVGWVLSPTGHGAGTSTAPTGRTPYCGPVTPQLPTTGAVPVRTAP